MAYEVTATRRRPQRFEDLVGQEFVAQTFKNSIQSGKIAHAYLFSGPRGCGKTSTARILAKALNCEKGPTATPCGECAACKEITAGSSLDVIEIDGASNTSVNDVRQIKDEVLFPPNSCRYKIYIIDEVHMLSTSAFNALLKTIEEPPPYVIFIFATTELQKVPATIKSRCQQFNFRLVPVEKVKEQLALAAQELGMKAQDEALYWIAREAGGSMRDSYTLFDQVAAFSDGELTYEKIRDKLGLVGVDRLNELFGFCVKGDCETALLKLDDYLQAGVSIEQLISNCTDYLRSLLLIKNGVKKEALLGQNAERFSADVIDAWNTIQIERALSIFMQLYRDIRYSLSPRYEFELAVSRLCWLKDYVSAVEVKRAVEAVKPLLSSAAYPRRIQVDESGMPVQSASPSKPVQDVKPSSAGGMNFFAGIESGGGEQQTAGGEQRPFPDGGAEPPVKSAAFEFNKAGENKDSAKNTSGYNSVSEYENYSPDENIAPDEDVTQNENTAPSVSLSDIDSSLPEAERIKRALIQEFSFKDELIASALNSAVECKLENETLTLIVEQQFTSIQLMNVKPVIEAKLAALRQKRTEFKVTVRQIIKEEKKLPPQVELVRDIFKGSVLGY